MARQNPANANFSYDFILELYRGEWRQTAHGLLICITAYAIRAALTIGLGGAEAPGPEQGGGPWLAVE